MSGLKADSPEPTDVEGMFEDAAYWNRYNQYTPWGNVEWNDDRSSMTQTLSPEMLQQQRMRMALSGGALSEMMNWFNIDPNMYSSFGNPGEQPFDPDNPTWPPRTPFPTDGVPGGPGDTGNPADYPPGVKPPWQLPQDPTGTGGHLKGSLARMLANFIGSSRDGAQPVGRDGAQPVGRDGGQPPFDWWDDGQPPFDWWDDDVRDRTPYTEGDTRTPYPVDGRTPYPVVDPRDPDLIPVPKDPDDPFFAGGDGGAGGGGTPGGQTGGPWNSWGGRQPEMFWEDNPPSLLSELNWDAIPDLPSLEDFEGDRNRITNAMYEQGMGLLDPYLRETEGRGRQSLANRGISTAAEIGRAEMGDFGRMRGKALGDLSFSSLMGGYDEASRQFGLGLSAYGQGLQGELQRVGVNNNARTQAWNETMGVRNQKWNELATLLGFNQTQAQQMGYNFNPAIDTMQGYGMEYQNNQFNAGLMNQYFSDLMGAAQFL